MLIKVLNDHVEPLCRLSQSWIIIVQYFRWFYSLLLSWWEIILVEMFLQSYDWPQNMALMLLFPSFAVTWATGCTTPLYMSRDEEIDSLISRSSFHSGWQVTAWWQLNKPIYRISHTEHIEWGQHCPGVQDRHYRRKNAVKMKTHYSTKCNGM